MALTRKFLSALGIEADKIDEIIEAHSETVNALKAERDDLKGKASQTDDLQRKLDEANEKLEASGDNGKYEELKKAFDNYKAETEAKAVLAVKDKAYRQLLKDCGVSEKRIDAVMKLTDLSEFEVDGDKVKDVDKVKETIKTEWSDFILSEKTEGAGTDTPPRTEEVIHTPVSIPQIF